MINVHKSEDMEKNYQLMVEVIKSILSSETDVIANLSNVSSIVNVYLDRLNWAGFYILKENQLVLGPFQGQPACIRIKVGQGVCGKAVSQRKTIVVPNVHEFEGHIACDSKTNSEIVVPIFKGEDVYGVLDLDSPDLNRFTDLESKYLQQVTKLLGEFLTEKI